MSLGARPLSSSRFNGETIQKKKLHGKASTSSILAIQNLSYRREESCGCLLFLLELFSFLNLGMIFLVRGEGCDNPGVTVAATMFYSISAM
jgi:hypothetical protein